MTRLRYLSLTLFSGTALLLAQDPQTGGWRRAGDPAPAPPVGRAQQPDPAVLDQDPSQPVARSDAYGQPQQQPAEPYPQSGAPPMQPQMQPQVRTNRPPAAVPHYGLPPALTMRAGTFVTVRVNQPLSSDHNQQGDLFTASLAQPIVVDGIVVAQRGQNVIGRVAEASKSGHGHSSSRLALQLTSITMADGAQANVQSQMVNRTGPSNVGNQVGAVATTTAVGAAIGGAADWGRGAAIGAGAGAAAGIIGVLLTPGRPTIVYPETLLTFRIDSTVAINLTHAPSAFRYVGPDEYDRPMQNTVDRRPPPPPATYGAPAPYPAYGYGYGYGAYAPYPYYGGFWGPSFGVVVRGGYGYGYGYGGYRRWR